jgi:hypothetical protein
MFIHASRAVDANRLMMIVDLFVKTLTMTELVNEAIQHVSKRFPPRVCDVKLQIDWLVENEYLARGETRGVLNYLA